MWQWMKHWSTTSLQSQISSQLSGQQWVKAVQSDQKHKHQQVRFWPSYWDAQGILFINYLEKGRTINTRYYIALLVHLKEEIAKKRPQIKKKKKSALSPRKCTMSQIDCNNGKTTWIALWIASAPTLFSRSGPQWVLAVCRPRKNAPGKEIWLQWRRDIGNQGRFWGQRQIVWQKKDIELLEKQWNQCVILEGDYVDE